ncbi:ArsR/SmtB family transcription factor [Planomonospora venezuelensis]|uniref:DNA-binding transcriptional ArsR family regulator n=1 Tax=Planomonospora venezuelensis TaxID=1999 RepID=A0A841CTF5_PLAVE|nr:DNA-binding transcriptional ArsR family regulator [Planomonospora venezuelensis]GIM98848.1 transcriptional regulator [Planomonospora venezuelensis]
MSKGSGGVRKRSCHVEWVFAPDDVARIRFAFSPIWELVASLRTLRDPARRSLHLPWLRAVRPRLAGLDLSELFALVPTAGYLVDFVTPTPDTPEPDFAAELERVRRTPPDRAAVEAGWVSGADPRIIERFRADPGTGVARVADTLQRYWEVAFAEFWPRVHGLLEAEVTRRSRQLAAGGARELFADLHPNVSWRGDRLAVVRNWEYSAPLGGDGLVLVPTAFWWPDTATMVEPYQPMLVYPATGVGTLWSSGPPPAPGALAALIGRTRAQILLALADPSTTSALARRMELTPGAVSQHLTVLTGGGLAVRRRLGREVVYSRTPVGDSLVCTP